jgi:hypothetical protein
MSRPRRGPLGLTPDQIFGDESPPVPVSLEPLHERSLAWLTGYAVSEFVHRFFSLFRRRR